MKTKIFLPKKAQEVMAKIKNAGFEVYAVGGCLRDLLLGKKTKDWDFTTSATPQQVLSLFPEGFYDNKFGTVGLVVQKPRIKSQKPIIYEITTFRSESGYSDFRHPNKVIWGTTLEEDLKRRDFTINALAFDGKKLIDLHGGQEDLKKRIVKTVGDPNQRFQEDALRLIRAIRIAAQLEFLIEEKTFWAIKKNAFLLKNISAERIREELLKILATSYPFEGVKLLRNAGILSLILPELEKCFGVEQKSPKRHHIFDVGTHLFLSLKYCPSKNPLVRLATLLHDIGKPLTFKKNPEGVITFYNHEIIGASIAENIARRLNFSKKEREKLFRLIRFHQFTLEEKQTDAALRRFIKNVGRENLEDILALRIGDRLGGGAKKTSWRLELFKKRLYEVQKKPFTVTDLKVDGFDVMKIYQIGPGPVVGKVLDILFQDVLQGKLPNQRKILLKRIKELKEQEKREIPLS